MTVAQGQIRLRPVTKKNIRALVQWIKDNIRTSQDPESQVFTRAGADITTLLQKAQKHDCWTSKSSDMAKTAKPKQFSQDVKWLDWRDSFVNFLRSQSGRKEFH